MNKLDEDVHKVLADYALTCAALVLPLFEKKYPDDDRPRKAIEAGRNWIYGKIKMTEARRFAFAAHAAARNAKHPEAIAAARSAGQAVATAHVPEHAFAAAEYAAKAVDPE